MLRQDSAVKSSLVVNEVAGVLDAGQIGGIVERACGAERMVIDAASEFEPNFSPGVYGKVMVTIWWLSFSRLVSKLVRLNAQDSHGRFPDARSGP